MKVLVLMDNFLVDRIFQKFSNSFQKLTGKSCFFISGLFYYLISIMFFILAATALVCLKGFVGVLGSVPSFFVALIFFALGYHIKKEEKIFYLAAASSLNLNKVLLEPLRILLLLIFPLYVYGLANGKIPWPFFVFFVFFGLAIYFASCIPLPPCKSKIRVWLESFITNYFSEPVRGK